MATNRWGEDDYGLRDSVSQSLWLLCWYFPTREGSYVPLRPTGFILTEASPFTMIKCWIALSKIHQGALEVYHCTHLFNPSKIYATLIFVCICIYFVCHVFVFAMYLYLPSLSLSENMLCSFVWLLYLQIINCTYLKLSSSRVSSSLSCSICLRTCWAHLLD